MLHCCDNLHTTEHVATTDSVLRPYISWLFQSYSDATGLYREIDSYIIIPDLTASDHLECSKSLVAGDYCFLQNSFVSIASRQSTLRLLLGTLVSWAVNRALVDACIFCCYCWFLGVLDTDCHSLWTYLITRMTFRQTFSHHDHPYVIGRQDSAMCVPDHPQILRIC